jgi:hypothetical protein
MLDRQIGSVPLWEPFAMVLIILPFALNILALSNTEKSTATITMTEG